MSCYTIFWVYIIWSPLILHTHLPIPYHLSFFSLLSLDVFLKVFIINDFKLNDDEPMISKTVSLLHAWQEYANSKPGDLLTS